MLSNLLRLVIIVCIHGIKATERWFRESPTELGDRNLSFPQHICAPESGIDIVVTLQLQEKKNLSFISCLAADSLFPSHFTKTQKSVRGFKKHKKRQIRNSLCIGSPSRIHLWSFLTLCAFFAVFKKNHIANMKHTSPKEINECRQLKTQKCKDYPQFYHWWTLPNIFLSLCVCVSVCDLFPSLRYSQRLEECLAKRRHPVQYLLKDGWLNRLSGQPGQYYSKAALQGYAPPASPAQPTAIHRGHLSLYSRGRCRGVKVRKPRLTKKA